MRTADFDYDLPPELIAQEPAPHRDDSRLLVLQRSTGRVEHRCFREFPNLLRPGDVMVFNDSRVIPARLRGRNARTAGQFELLLLTENAVNDWWVMLRPGRRARQGTVIEVLGSNDGPSGLTATVVGVNAEGHRRVQFSGVGNIKSALDTIGEIPLPPYIRRTDREREELDRERYQTVYARARGSVAAPTAGLHFTPATLDEVRGAGAEIAFVTLHVGLGTFAPVKAELLSHHKMHEEHYTVSAEAAALINQARATGRRVLAVGTTTVRVLESVAGRYNGTIHPESASTDIFIYPPFHFRIVDAMLTNFHLPRSTLLMLASAFASPGAAGGREVIMSAYAEAVRQRYRFFSYGDAMLMA